MSGCESGVTAEDFLLLRHHIILSTKQKLHFASNVYNIYLVAYPLTNKFNSVNKTVNSSLICSSIPSCTKQEMENKAEAVLFYDIILSKIIGWGSLLSMQNSGRKKYHRNDVIGTLINDMPT